MSETWTASATSLVSFGVSGEMNNGVKKEVFGKDAARIWINDNIKMHNFTHPMVIIISLWRKDAQFC